MKELISQLKNQEIDICLSTFPVIHSEIEWLPLIDEEILLSVPESHRFAGRESILLSEVADEPFISITPEYYFRKLTDNLCRQATMSAEEADKLVEILELDSSISLSLQEFAMKGSLKDPIPTDPLIYRFYEIVQVYGTTLKSVIQEKCGDGIMSAIDFTMDIQKKEDPKGDRVVVTLDGKLIYIFI